MFKPILCASAAILLLVVLIKTEAEGKRSRPAAKSPFEPHVASSHEPEEVEIGNGIVYCNDSTPAQGGSVIKNIDLEGCNVLENGGHKDAKGRSSCPIRVGTKAGFKIQFVSNQDTGLALAANSIGADPQRQETILVEDICKWKKSGVIDSGNCPILEGFTYSLERVITIPEWLPTGDYMARMRILGEDGILLCFLNRITIYDPAEELVKNRVIYKAADLDQNSDDEDHGQVIYQWDR